MTSHDHEFDEKVHIECCESHAIVMTTLNRHLSKKMPKLIERVREAEFDEEEFFKIIYDTFIGPAKKLETMLSYFKSIVERRIIMTPGLEITELPRDIENGCYLGFIINQRDCSITLRFENRYLVIIPVIDISKPQKITQIAYGLLSEHHELVTPVGVLLTLYKKKSAAVKQQIEQDYLIYLGGLNRVINLRKEGPRTY